MYEKRMLNQVSSSGPLSLVQSPKMFKHVGKAHTKLRIVKTKQNRSPPLKLLQCDVTCRMLTIAPLRQKVSPPMVCPGAHGYVHQGKEYGGGVARGAELNPSTNRFGHHCMRTYTMISGCSICSGLLRSGATMCPHHAHNNQNPQGVQSLRLCTAQSISRNSHIN